MDLGHRKVCAVVRMAILLQCCLFAAEAILDPLDFLALQSIRKAMEDLPGSDFFSSWDFTSDPCGFAGILCDDGGSKVIALNLGDPRAGSPGLSGQIDPAVGRLSSLAELTVVPGRIHGALPDTISELKGLRFIGVSQNFISGGIPQGLTKITSLRTIDLSFNQINGSIPWSIGTLPSLTNLILSHNRLSGSIPPFLSQALTRLDLDHNDLTGSIAPYTFPPSLQYLSLSWNRLSGPVDRVLSRLDRLNYLDLSMNRFTGAIPGRVFGFPIRSLQLQRNTFSGPVEPAAAEVKMETVDLSYNRLSGDISPAFAAVENLYLNNNRFTGEVPGSFVDRLLAASIQTLYLQHNYLTRIMISPAAEIPLTAALCLQYNCMVPPVQTPCPSKAGKQKTRPTEQCSEWKG